MTQKQLAIKRYLEDHPLEAHTYAVIHNEVYKRLTGVPNSYKNSNGLAQVDSFRTHENSFINSYNR
jgi:hypothetical protein